MSRENHLIQFIASGYIWFYFKYMHCNLTYSDMGFFFFFLLFLLFTLYKITYQNVIWRGSDCFPHLDQQRWLISVETWIHSLIHGHARTHTHTSTQSVVSQKMTKLRVLQTHLWITQRSGCCNDSTGPGGVVFTYSDKYHGGKKYWRTRRCNCVVPYYAPTHPCREMHPT